MAAVEVIVLGGSAGGMKAVRQILSALTGLRTCVLCVVLHRPAEYSPLAEVLQTYTPLPVREPPDSPWDCPGGAVTVAPAGYHLLLGRGRVPSTDGQEAIAPYTTAPGVRAHLTLDGPVAYSRPSLDVTFTSAAEFGASVIAVLLSCANEDGAAGCAAVQAAGGRVVLQAPGTCEAPIAVNAAARRIEPDHVADPAGIGSWLGQQLALGAKPH
ncbi:chemotaxis protein CheB [Mycolicibacterium parafortuitum]|uniref:protein-glutamate methylesterase n=1 Tax=Mycolicibacterium parafortuitum TaxID=39692 RepID=A0A375YD48_MYCPF|nr:chemotaxis protein CheB [Mycolicibacterium parafortuitum]ORB31027.1 chemotaxis protein CheB [Mycolicibacterium parafortuitum]SRX79047.1 CheB methylesterase [Flavobacterium johnsoniae UW101] [Mycolicibacterium parafortuitum]